MWTLGALAGLLIAKWTGCDAALVTGVGDRPAEHHARKLVNAVWESDAAVGAAIRVPVIATAREAPAVYHAILDRVRLLDLGTPAGRQMAAAVLEDAIRLLVSRNGENGGSHFTPPGIADFMVELADPVPGESIYDPCFGFGGLLLTAARRLPSELPSGNIRQVAFFGGELDVVVYPVGLCRLLLAGIDCRGLASGDSLDPEGPESLAPPKVFHRRKGHDCILATPPWGRSPDYRSSPCDHFPIRGHTIENLFVQHVMANLSPGGRAVMALPEGLLFRGGPDGKVRKALLSDYRVDGVVSLPAGMFEPFTSLPMSLLRFSRNPPRSTVRFASVSPTAWEAAALAGEGFGPGAGSGAGFADGSGLGAGTPVISQLVREISRLIRHDMELSAGMVSPGVEVWEVSAGELAIRSHELVAKEPGDKKLNTALSRLAATDRSLRVEPLERIGDVFKGLRYARDVATAQRAARDVVAGLVRVGDVTDDAVRPPSLFLAGKAKVDATDRFSLRSGDLVITTSGTVGKIGHITDDPSTVPVLATGNMAVVRSGEGIRPGFIAALLRTPTYRNWLSGHARGTTIRHLAIRTLRSLRVPVPPIALQDAVLDELSEPRADALAVLYRLLHGGENLHPVTVWLESPLVAQLAAGGLGDDRDGIRTLSAAMEGIRSLTGPAGHSTPTRAHDRASAWLAVARRTAIALDGITTVPHGSGRLALLELASARFHQSLGILDGVEAPIIERLRSFSRAMVELAEQEVQAMQRAITLIIDVDPVEVQAGVTSEVRLGVENASDVPLRGVRVTAKAPDGTTANDEFRYLAERAKQTLPIAVEARDNSEPWRIDVAWQASRLDGTPVGGTTHVSLEVGASREGLMQAELGANPYIVGSPVEQQEMFFGRAHVMAQIKRQLGARGHANVILLEGNRRTGKTSILRQIEKTDLLDGWIPVYCSLQEVEKVSSRDVFRLLARRTGWTLHDAGVRTWFPGHPAPDPSRPFKPAFSAALTQPFAGENVFEAFQLYLTAAIAAASPRRILLMLDEFDKLQEGIDAGIASPQVPENIRHLLQHQPGVCAIITGSRRLKRLREEYWSALFGLGLRVGVSELPLDDAKLLVTEPVRKSLSYLPQARDRVVELCARHPFLIQSLCSRVFDQTAQGRGRIITLDTVERAATEMVRDNEHFRTLWDYAGNERRRLLLLLCDRLAPGPDVVNLTRLELALHDKGIRVRRRRELADDIVELRELELLARVPVQHGRGDDRRSVDSYRLSIPLMATWLRKNVDFDDLVVRAKEEAED